MSRASLLFFLFTVACSAPDTDHGDGAGGTVHGTGGNGTGGNSTGGQGAGGGGATGGAGTGGQGGVVDPACEALGVSLQGAIDTYYASSPAQTVGGASVAVIRGSCRWVGAVGEAHTGEPMTTAHLFRIASVTKTYVAVTLLSLVEDGVLGLDDTVDSYVPGVPAGDLITVRMLLNHTNGIYDYLSDQIFWQQALAQPNVAVTPQALVDVGTSHPATPPGQGWNYTNTGFILAGMVIEAVTQTSAGSAIRQRAFVPAGLDASYFDGEDALPAPLVTGFGAQGEDVTYALHPSVSWTAGSVVTTAGDLADWAAALYGGHVLSAAALGDMLTPVPTGDAGLGYGLGAFIYDASKLGNIGPGVGHSGKLPGFHTNMFYMVNDGTVVVQIGNSDTGKNFAGILLVTLYPH